MAVKRRLSGRRIAVLAADGFEKVELTVPVAALRAEGAEVEIVSLRPGRIRGLSLHEPAARVAVDCTLAEADPARYDALFVPGGSVSPDLLRQSEAARRFVREFDADGKPIASLCHGVALLASAGLAQGRRTTSSPGIRDDLVEAGATWLDEPVVRDGNWITGRRPHDLGAFVAALVERFSAALRARRPVATDVASAPQRRAAPSLVVRALTRLPRPALRTAVVLAAVLMVWALRGRNRWAAHAS